MARPVALYYTMLRYQAENLARLRDRFEVIEVPTPDDDRPDLLARAELCFAPLGFRFDADKMDRCLRLKAIASNTTGVAHIDTAAAAARGVAVFSLENEQAFLSHITATAEHTFGLLLALVRRTPWAHAAVLDGGWDRRPFGAPAMLSRMALGVVGYGRLGRMVARYGRAFGMAVRYFDPFVRDEDGAAKRAPSLEGLVGGVDVVSLHAPANETTRRMIDRDLLARFKPGSYLVNTARGELVDEGALLAALEGGRLAGAALDVLEGEFEPGFRCADHPLVAYARDHQNLLLTPHVGGSTIDAWRETERRVIDMAAEFFSHA